MRVAKPMSQLVAGVLCMLLAAPMPAGGQENIPARRWKLKYEAGSAQFAANESVSVLVNRETVLLLGGSSYDSPQKDQAIPVEDITQITYDTARGRYVARAIAGTAADIQSGADVVMYLYFMVPLTIVTLPFKGTRHFVTIEWTEGSRHRAVVLRMKGGTAKEFIAELEQATGKPARNLDREREEFRKEQLAKKAAQKQDAPATPAPER